MKDNDKDTEFNTYIDRIINRSPKKLLQDEQVVGEGPTALVYQQKEENPPKLKDNKIRLSRSEISGEQTSIFRLRDWYFKPN